MHLHHNSTCHQYTLWAARGTLHANQVIQLLMNICQVPPKGAVATDDPECSRIGIDVLLKGGNAIDAAVASTLCMCVVHPHMTSLGGLKQSSPLPVQFSKVP